MYIAGMAHLSSHPTEADILAQIIAPGDGTLPRSLAQAVLDFRFDREATQRMEELAAKSADDSLTEEEREVLDRYLRVGTFLNLLQAKARCSLADSAPS